MRTSRWLPSSLQSRECLPLPKPMLWHLSWLGRWKISISATPTNCSPGSARVPLKWYAPTTQTSTTPRMKREIISPGWEVIFIIGVNCHTVQSVFVGCGERWEPHWVLGEDVIRDLTRCRSRQTTQLSEHQPSNNQPTHSER